MRTIKFRILVSDGWKYFTLDDLLSGMYLGVEIDNDKMLAKCQFTGLTDKNGKEIYEGDIVNTGISNYEVKFGKYSLSGSDEDMNSGSLHEWSEEAYGWYIGGHMGNETLEDWFEVIGNIYENPKLLEEKV